MQPREGYRYSLDPFLLADNITAESAHRIADLGTGNGILPLLLSKLFPRGECWGLDIQREPLVCALKNCEKLETRPRFIQSDLRQASSLLKANAFNLVVSNPPYRKAGSGRLNRVGAKAIARHEISLTLDELAHAASHLLTDGGEFCLIHLAERSEEVLDVVRAKRLAPKTVRFLHSKSGENPFRVIVNCVKNGKDDVTLLPPFSVYSNDSEYTDAMNRIYQKFDI